MHISYPAESELRLGNGFSGGLKSLSGTKASRSEGFKAGSGGSRRGAIEDDA